MFLIRLIFIFLLSLPLSLAHSASDLRHRSIYQVLTDRFARADDKITECELAEKQYCGGSWKGIERKLDYIQGMGFDTGKFLLTSAVVQDLRCTSENPWVGSEKS